jgi:transposase InsO family protein
MKFAFILAKSAEFPVFVLCAVLAVSRSGFYAWRRRPAAARVDSDAQLAAAITSIFRRSHGAYGSPRIHAELKARGIRVSRKRVERLMQVNGLKARQKRRFRKTTDSNHSLPIAPNVLERQFDVDAPNSVWVTDVTYVATTQGWLYLAVMLDLFSRRVVGWAVSESNDTALALLALERSRGSRRPRAGLIHHSDRGSPYASESYRQALKAHGIVASMSRSGDCWDNAVAESFFASLRAEWVDHQQYATRVEATRSLGEYIDRFYNPVRRHSHLGYLSPIEFELRSQTVGIAA